jgi:predicted RNA binding protein with dsRBD fold (UPF0201 family)
VAGLKIWARVGPSEDPGRVRRAVESLVPGVGVVQEGEGFSAALSTGDLGDLRRKFLAKKVGKTVGGQLWKNRQGTGTRLLFNRQAAFAGKVALVERYGDSPLGAVVLELPWDEELVGWLTGVTKSPRPRRSRR